MALVGMGQPLGEPENSATPDATSRGKFRQLQWNLLSHVLK
jgi:hypothetical protein